MMTLDERKQVRNFQDNLTDIVDRYLKEGMEPDLIRQVLGQEINSDLETRRAELEMNDFA